MTWPDPNLPGAYKDGAHARLADQGVDQNPYNPEVSGWEQWMAGWEAAHGRRCEEVIEQMWQSTPGSLIFLGEQDRWPSLLWESSYRTLAWAVSAAAPWAMLERIAELESPFAGHFQKDSGAAKRIRISDLLELIVAERHDWDSVSTAIEEIREILQGVNKPTIEVKK